MTATFMTAHTHTAKDTLFVERTDISFRNVEPDRVRIEVVVSNPSSLSSEPTMMVVQAAPLGAFLPWREVAIMEVPSIGPFGSIPVDTEVALPQTKSLGDFSNVPPQTLLATMDENDEPSRPDATGNSIGNIFARLLRQPGQETELPNGPFDLLTRKNVHWAGNINILIGEQAVERHLAQALRIYPGMTNLAMFFVGAQPDAYKFALAGSGADWGAALFDMSFSPSLLNLRNETNAIPLSQWVKMDGRRIILLAVSPPEFCGEGNVEVHVKQQSSGKDAVVEFSLDPNAASAGCYAV